MVDLPAELLAGWRLIRDGNYTSAATYFSDLRIRYPGSTDAATGIAWAYLLQDSQDSQVEEGRRLLISLLNVEMPHHVTTLAALAGEAVSLSPRTTGEALLLVNNALFQREIEEAVRLARRAQEFAPHNLFVLANVGTALAFAGKDDEALPLLRQVAESAPTPAVWHNIGVIEARRKNYTAAEEALRQALVLVPDYLLAHEALAWEKLRSGQLVSALKHWRVVWAVRKRNQKAREAATKA